MIYLDNAATSYPKPPAMMQAMSNFLERAGGNPGRSGHRLSIEAGRIVYDTRELIASLFNVSDPLRVIFTLNATHALNIVIRGLVRPGDRVVTTSMEHNAVMRPLRALERQGVQLDVVPCASDGTPDLGAMQAVLKTSARLVVTTHASNVTGTMMPVAEIAEAAHRAGALFLVDAAQTAGALPIDMQSMNIDILAFTGHKGLQGPPGTGGLVLNDSVHAVAIEPLMRGGTGSKSESEDQPEFLPDKFESGTPNGVGIAGLGAGVRSVLDVGVSSIRAHENELTHMLIGGLCAIPGITFYGPRETANRVSTISFTVANKRVSEIGLRLDEEHGVLCRVGLHCAPAAHRTIGTFPEGTIRFAPGMWTTANDIRTAIQAVEQVIQE